MTCTPVSAPIEISSSCSQRLVDVPRKTVARRPNHDFLVRWIMIRAARILEGVLRLGDCVGSSVEG
ncbi:MAG: hypothetical protein U0360_04940 [Dehalococcoidia bacterium]